MNFKLGIGGVVGALLTCLIGTLLIFLPFGQGLVHKSYDFFFAPRPSIETPEVALVYMDDESYDALKQDRLGAWDRALHAKLVNRLTDAGAKGILFDIVFTDPNPNKAANDEAFAQALKRAGNVVLAADSVPMSREGGFGRKVVPPAEIFDNEAADIGLAELVPDDDFVVRRLFVGEPPPKNEAVSPMTWALAEVVGAKITEKTNANRRYIERSINYYSKPATLPSYSYLKLVSDDPAEQPKWDEFKGKVVFVGSKLVTQAAGERKDEYVSPYAAWNVGRSAQRTMPGVEVQATIFLNLLREDWLTQPRFSSTAAAIALFGVLFGLMAGQMRTRPAIIASLGSMVALTVGSYYVFKDARIWWPWLIPVGVQIPTACIWSVIFNGYNDLKGRLLMSQSLSMYLSPSQAKKIAASGKGGGDMLKPGAKKMEISILFSDIANFTTFSEGLDSDELAKLMNGYFEKAVGGCIQKTDGTVIKFIGDAIFAVWNAPDLQPNHQELACKGALLLRDSVNDFKVPKEGVEVRTRIGLHCGVANVGNFGSSQRIDYTAIGENINLASRMEGLNKHLGTDVLITGEVYDGVKDKFITRFVGKFRLKGFGKAVDVHELLGHIGQAGESAAWREPYAAALAHFLKRELEAARAGFQQVLQLKPKDGPSKYMIHAIEELLTAPTSGAWDGVVEMHEK